MKIKRSREQLVKIKKMNASIQGKKILVTGGSGSIGSEIVRQCLKAGAEVVRVFSRDESRQYELQQELGTDNLRFLLGDVRDKDRLKRAMKQIDLVFHAAALKQVPYCEYNPYEAVQTNVVGAQNLVESALDAGVSKVVGISTDKSVNPVNTMGATKLLSERIITNANLWTDDTTFSCVRFGNVLGSRGSVVPLIRQQVELGGPVQLTDAKMTRFMMSIPEAAGLVLKASALAKAGETFVLPMKALNVKDMITVLRDHFCDDLNVKKCTIKEVGMRPGEKMHEELVTQEELARVRKVKNYLVVESLPGKRKGPKAKLEEKEYISSASPKMKQTEIIQLLKKAHVI